MVHKEKSLQAAGTTEMWHDFWILEPTNQMLGHIEAAC